MYKYSTLFLKKPKKGLKFMLSSLSSLASPDSGRNLPRTGKRFIRPGDKPKAGMLPLLINQPPTVHWSPGASEPGRNSKLVRKLICP